MSRGPDETVMDYIRRVVSWLNVNDESMLDPLPSVESVFELFDLISDTYDTSTIDEMYEIAREDGNWNPIWAFIEKHKLSNWATE